MKDCRDAFNWLSVKRFEESRKFLTTHITFNSHEQRSRTVAIAGRLYIFKNKVLLKKVDHSPLGQPTTIQLTIPKQVYGVGLAEGWGLINMKNSRPLPLGSRHNLSLYDLTSRVRRCTLYNVHVLPFNASSLVLVRASLRPSVDHSCSIVCHDSTVCHDSPAPFLLVFPCSHAPLVRRRIPPPSCSASCSASASSPYCLPTALMPYGTQVHESNCEGNMLPPKALAHPRAWTLRQRLRPPLPRSAHLLAAAARAS